MSDEPTCRWHPDQPLSKPVTLIDATGKKHENVRFCWTCEREGKR